MTADSDVQKRWTRRRATIVASAATAGAVSFVSALALTGTFGTTHGNAVVNAPVTAGWTSHATLTRALKAIAASAGPTPSYYAYVAASTGDEIIEVNVAKAAIVGEISADTADGVALTPNGSTAYIAETGQYYVLADDLATKAQTKIEVGAYPEDVAVSPSGKVVYATGACYEIQRMSHISG
jgi:hypothetical protein